MDRISTISERGTKGEKPKNPFLNQLKKTKPKEDRKKSEAGSISKSELAYNESVVVP